MAIAYLAKDGKPDKNFNKERMASGHAVIEDFRNNEFDPESLW